MLNDFAHLQDDHCKSEFDVLPAVVAPMKAIDDKLSVSKPARVAVHAVFFQGTREVVNHNLRRAFQIRPQHGKRIVATFRMPHHVETAHREVPAAQLSIAPIAEAVATKERKDPARA